jgi:hypothetical protein
MRDWTLVNNLEILMGSLAVGAVAFYLIVQIGAAFARRNENGSRQKH